jgi:hypothetical protein
MMNPFMPHDPIGLYVGQPNVQPPPPRPQPQAQIPASLSVTLDDDEQQEVVRYCNTFWKNSVTNTRAKKDMMLRCYAYSVNQFYGDDLLPKPGVQNDNDNNKNRPQIFIPGIREQLNNLYSYIKLTIFPNDEDYFRIKGKNEQAAILEQDLTDGFMQLFKQEQISEKLSQFLYNLCWAGFSAGYPTVTQDVTHVTQMGVDDQGNPLYVTTAERQPARIDFRCWNPINFFVDNLARDRQTARWCYWSVKKLYELQDSMLYIQENVQQVTPTKNPMSYDIFSGLDMTQWNYLQTITLDNEEDVMVHQYFIPCLKTSRNEYRNMLVTIANGQTLIEFRPNLLRYNPGIFTTWRDDVDTPYGIGPAEEMVGCQRLINILYNAMIEDLARNGNRFVARPEVDLTQLFGVAGGIAITNDPRNDIVPLQGDLVNLAHLQNIIGTLKAEMQLCAGSQNPFQGASNIDFKKTATEIQLLQENSISNMREIVEKISNTAIQPAIESLCSIAAEIGEEPIMVRRDTPGGGEAFIPVDLSIFNNGQYSVEMTSVNPSQSKQQQINIFNQLLQMAASTPQAVILTKPILLKIAQIAGIGDADSILNEVIQNFQAMQAQPPIPQQAQPPVPQ